MSFPNTVAQNKVFSLRGKTLRLGFVALTDAAPLVAAQEMGFFAKHHLHVTLTREVGWATIREKTVYNELDAAHCLAPLLWSTHLGIDSVPCRVLTALILSVRGNAVTLSTRLHEAGVRDAATLRNEARRRMGERRLTLGVVFPHSSHHLLLRAWLKSGGLDPDKDVRIVVVPPAQMFRNLSAGTIDGYCSGEPWNTAAVQAGIGWCPTWSSAQSLAAIEKVLMVTDRFARERAEEHSALIAALVEACAWCDVPANRPALASLLSSPKYLGQPVSLIEPSLVGKFVCGYGKSEYLPDFHVFHQGGANCPTVEKAETLQQEWLDASLFGEARLAPSLPTELFREDLYREAIRNLPSHELIPA